MLARFAVRGVRGHCHDGLDSCLLGMKNGKKEDHNIMVPGSWEGSNKCRYIGSGIRGRRISNYIRYDIIITTSTYSSICKPRYILVKVGCQTAKVEKED